MVVAPYVDVSHDELELTTCLEVKTLIFLHRIDWELKKVWPPWYEPLKLNPDRVLSSEMKINILACYSDFFVIISNNKWPYHSVISSSYCEWGSMWHDKVNVWEFFTTFDDSGYCLIFDHLLESVIGLTLSDWVEVDWLC